MKRKFKSFGVKLWVYFALFAAIIFVALWLLQTVFLQNFFNGMAIKNVKEVAAQIAASQNDADLASLLDNLAYKNSLLIFLTDGQGTIFYSTDEHSHIYKGNRAPHDEDDRNDNPYRAPNEILSWQIGALRNLSLPQDYDIFLQNLSESKDGTVGYQINNDSAYVYGMTLSEKGGDRILYISTSLGAVGATVAILRTQLIWVTGASLLLAFAIAFFIARRFSRPVTVISAQAKHLAEGDFTAGFQKGFCAELDELADTLSQTSSELSKAESFRREFLANISHDLRTPLTMIRGYAEMVRDISWGDDMQRETDLSIIIRETNRLTGLVNEILEYTSLQSKVQTMKYEGVDISVAAQKVLAQFEPLCARNGYNIEAHIEASLTVYGNRRQLSRVLYNLIDNAISHAGEKKTVKVVLKDAGMVVRAEVCDFGNGISKNDLPYIWERYFTLKQQKRNEKGSGLGLAISKEILLAHNANFGVESTEGQGSTFWFELKKVAA